MLFSRLISIFVFDILQIPGGCIRIDLDAVSAPSCTFLDTGQALEQKRSTHPVNQKPHKERHSDSMTPAPTACQMDWNLERDSLCCRDEAVTVIAHTSSDYKTEQLTGKVKAGRVRKPYRYCSLRYCVH
jgi:hypothetical protein